MIFRWNLVSIDIDSIDGMKYEKFFSLLFVDEKHCSHLSGILDNEYSEFNMIQMDINNALSFVHFDIFFVSNIFLFEYLQLNSLDLCSLWDCSHLNSLMYLTNNSLCHYNKTLAFGISFWILFL